METIIKSEIEESLTAAMDSNKVHPLWAQNHLVIALLNVRIKKDMIKKIKIKDCQLTKATANSMNTWTISVKIIWKTKLRIILLLLKTRNLWIFTRLLLLSRKNKSIKLLECKIKRKTWIILCCHLQIISNEEGISKYV